jgi:hypothetical protein
VKNAQIAGFAPDNSNDKTLIIFFLIVQEMTGDNRLFKA